jgi:hypothetical protein
MLLLHDGVFVITILFETILTNRKGRQTAFEVGYLDIIK